MEGMGTVVVVVVMGAVAVLVLTVDPAGTADVIRLDPTSPRIRAAQAEEVAAVAALVVVVIHLVPALVAEEVEVIGVTEGDHHNRPSRLQDRYFRLV